ncbi:MAG: response regulator [Dysgonomonas sp.]
MRLILSFIFFHLVLCANSQSIMQLKYYSVNEGLSQNRVLGSLQDDNGYIWVNTWNGLERFNGYSFQNFKTYPSDSIRMGNHRISTIIKSQLNNIWCLTHNNQLYLFDTKNEKFEDVFHYSKYNKPTSIRGLFVLDHGITWIIGSKGELYRINENEYKSDKAVELFKNNYINLQEAEFYNIFKDSQKDEWLLTNKGIVIYGNKKVNSHMVFKYITETKNGIYLGNNQGFLGKYSKDGNIIPCVPKQTSTSVTDVIKTSENKIAILTEDGITLYNTESNSYRHYYTTYKNEKYVPCYPFEDSKGNLWALSNKRKAIKINLSNGEISYYGYTSYFEFQNQYPSEGFFHEDISGCIWVKPHDGDFSFFNTKDDRLDQAFILKQNKKEYISFQSFNHIIDTHNNIWFANNQGVNHVSFSNIKYKYIVNSNGSEARSLMEDHAKRLWIGWRPKSVKQSINVEIYDQNNNWIGNLSRDGKVMKNPNVDFGSYVYCIYEDKDKNIWLGTKQDGVFILQPKDSGLSYQVTHLKHKESDPYSLSNNSVYSIIEDSKGRIWLGTFGGGVNLVEKNAADNELRFIHAGNHLNNYPIYTCDKVRCLYESENGTILIGTTEGLITLSNKFSSPETITFYHNKVNSSPFSLSNNDIMNITQKKGGSIFITAFSGGVNVTKDSELFSDKIEFKHYNKKNGFVPDFSMSVIDGLDGFMWIASENSFSKLNLQTNQIEDYNRQVLKIDFEISEAKPIIQSSGRLIFGTTDGALCISPQDINKSSFIPPIIFSDINIYEDGSYRTETLHGNKKEFEFGVTERNFKINFTALDYSNPHGIEYAYRVIGLTDEWIYIGKNRSASFASIPSGDYELQIKSTNGDGVWVENNTSLLIHVKPKFKETGWAIALYIFILLLFILLVSYIISYISNLRNKVDFEQKLTNLKLRFFTDISHELRTPLTLIASPIEEVINQEELSPEGSENMQIAKKNVDRMLHLINQILDFRKIQNNKMKVYIEYTDVVLIIKQVFENFRSIAIKKNINFELICPVNELMIYTDIDKLEKIIFNLLSNAFKYTQNDKTITVNITSAHNNLYINVKDEGKGFNINQINKLFLRFETTNNSTEWGSSGIGLSLVKELITLMHGSIQVDSSPDIGSEFTVQLPLTYEEYISDNNVEFILKDNYSDTPSPQNTYTDEDDTLVKEMSGKETTILIIEDNNELRKFICSILSKEYNTLEACNGKQGLIITENETPDIVISDIMMPEMDGIEYLKQVKENRDTSHIPIILLSARNSIEDRIQGLEYGADDYISKPFNSAYIKARIRSLLKQRKVLYNFYTNRELVDSKIDDTEKSTIQVTEFDDEFIRNVIANIENNIQNPDFLIDDLADAIGMSRTVFYRKLKIIIGQAPSDFVRDMRLKRAKELLDTDKYTISEVAYMSGFNTPQYFSKVFKDMTNYSPKEYRQRNKQM